MFFLKYFLYSLSSYQNKRVTVIELQNKNQKQPPQVFCKKGVLKNFAKFTTASEK